MLRVINHADNKHVSIKTDNPTHLIYMIESRLKIVKENLDNAKLSKETNPEYLLYLETQVNDLKLVLTELKNK